MNVGIPGLALVVLIGPTGAGKSTFARTHFSPTEVISSDFCRGLVADDENDQSATTDAFDLLHNIVGKRLKNARLTVVDATNVRAADRQPLVELARHYHVLPVAIVLNLPEGVCQARNAHRADRQFGPHVVRNHVREVRRSLKRLKGEGFRRIIILNSEEEIAQVRIRRERLWNDRRELSGPFDIIGDVHGCTTELEQLLARLGYEWTAVTTDPPFPATYHRLYHHPHGRTAIFLGDLVDRGPRNLDSYQLVRHMVAAGHALCVPGNHDVKLMRQLNGRNVQVRYGLDKTLAEMEMLPATIRSRFSREMADWIESLISHYVLDGGKLVVAHAGLKAELQGRASGRVREFALYGDTTGETDEFGLPVRNNWALDYRGKAAVVYGHTPVPQAEWLNNTINIDTGCVFGGQLTALRYPERELVAVPAMETYVEPVRPLHPPSTLLTAQQQHDDVLDIADVSGKRLIETRLMRQIIIPAANSTAALEVMSRFAINPQWLIYLPPTMSPSETSQEAEWLEHPAAAFDYFRQNGVMQLVCEEKHMGSRAVVIVGQEATAVQQRFGVSDGGLGIIYTRTGRRFFNDLKMEQALLGELHQALTAANFWAELETNWVCLDCELMPWSEKAQGLIQEQYAAVGAAAHASLPEANRLLQQAAGRSVPLAGLDDHYRTRVQLVEQYIQAYRPYCWPVNSIADLRLAPFHILATEGAVHSEKTHLWHMSQITRFVQAQSGQTLMATNHQLVDLGDGAQVTAVIHWWQTLTNNSGEGMVIKPINFVMHGKRGLIQPAIKCRGRDYLRLIYGPEYTLPDNLNRLRQRNVSRKRFLALREFALGLEALERFVRREPLRRVHECVFAVLAMESEPVDPRL